RAGRRHALSARCPGRRPARCALRGGVSTGQDASGRRRSSLDGGKHVRVLLDPGLHGLGLLALLEVVAQDVLQGLVLLVGQRDLPDVVSSAAKSSPKPERPITCIDSGSPKAPAGSSRALTG